MYLCVVLYQWMPLINFKLADDNEQVKKRAYVAANNVWRVCLHQLSTQSVNAESREMYNALKEITMQALKQIRSSNEGTAIVAIKLCETIATCYSVPSTMVPEYSLAILFDHSNLIA